MAEPASERPSDERIRDAIRTLIDPDLPWVHDESNPNCGACWECIAGTLGIARAMRRAGLQAEGALDIEDRIVWLNSYLAEAQARAPGCDCGFGDAVESSGLVAAEPEAQVKCAVEAIERFVRDGYEVAWYQRWNLARAVVEALRARPKADQ